MYLLFQDITAVTFEPAEVTLHEAKSSGCERFAREKSAEMQLCHDPTRRLVQNEP